MARATRLYAALTAPTRPFGMASRQAGRTVSSLAPALMPMWDKYMDNPENQQAFGELGKSAGEGMSSMLGGAMSALGDKAPDSFNSSGFAGALGSGAKTLQGLLPGLMERAGPMLGRMAPRVGAAVGSDLLAQGGDMLGAPQEEWDPSIRRQNMMMAMQLPPEMNVPDHYGLQGGGEQGFEAPAMQDLSSGDGGISQDFQARPMEALDPRLKAILAGQPDPGGSEPSDMGIPSADPVEAALGKGSWGKMASGAVGVIPGVGGVAGPVIEGVYDKLHAPVASVDPLARARQGALNLSGALDNASGMAGAAVKEMQGNSAPRFSPSQAATAPPPRMSAPPSLGSLLDGQRKSVPAPGPDRVAMAAAEDATKAKREDEAAQSSADQAFNHYLLPEARVYPPRDGLAPTLRDDSPSVGRKLSDVFSAQRRAEEQPRIRAPGNPKGNPDVSTFEDVDHWQQTGPYEWQFNKGRKRANLSRALNRTWM